MITYFLHLFHIVTYRKSTEFFVQKIPIFINRTVNSRNQFFYSEIHQGRSMTLRPWLSGILY